MVVEVVPVVLTPAAPVPVVGVALVEGVVAPVVPVTPVPVVVPVAPVPVVVPVVVPVLLMLEVLVPIDESVLPIEDPVPAATQFADGVAAGVVPEVLAVEGVVALVLGLVMVEPFAP